MVILGIESSAVSASAALVKDGKLLSEAFLNVGLTHSVTLLPLIRQVVEGAGLAVSDIDAVAVSNGPGSFTGVRIGVATAKGIAQPEDKKCVPLSTLEVIAKPLESTGVYAVAVMDARCNQVYCGIFLVDGEEITRLTEDMALKIDELEKILPDYENVVFVGDGARLCHSKLGYEIAPAGQLYQRGSSVAFAAEKSFSEENTVTAAELMPAYLRLPQAERELKARLNK